MHHSQFRSKDIAICIYGNKIAGRARGREDASAAPERGEGLLKNSRFRLSVPIFPRGELGSCESRLFSALCGSSVAQFFFIPDNFLIESVRARGIGTIGHKS